MNRASVIGKIKTRLKKQFERVILAAYSVVARQYWPGSENEKLNLLRQNIKDKFPDNPCSFGYKVYSQVDEDGIIQNILSRIPGHSRTFIEIGCGNGLENNTHYLLLQGYKGCWIDGGASNIDFMKRALGGLSFDSLLIMNAFVRTSNIASVINRCAKFLGVESPGLLSLDIDGNDIYLLQEILRYMNPDVLCVEYNAKFPPPISISVNYDEDLIWERDDYQGASLSAFCNLLTGYKLVCCNVSGTNAFFVRSDLETAFANYTIAELYQPARYNFIRVASGHPPSLKFLRDHLRRD